MRFYVAGPFDRRARLRAFADRLTNAGHDVVSAWVYADADRESEMRRGGEIAKRCLDDIDRAEIFVFFLPDVHAAQDGFGAAPLSTADFVGMADQLQVTGGTQVELGYALATHKQVWGIGDYKLNVFHHLDDIRWCADENAFVRFLEGK